MRSFQWQPSSRPWILGTTTTSSTASGSPVATLQSLDNQGSILCGHLLKTLCPNCDWANGPAPCFAPHRNSEALHRTGTLHQVLNKLANFGGAYDGTFAYRRYSKPCATVCRVWSSLSNKGYGTWCGQWSPLDSQFTATCTAKRPGRCGPRRMFCVSLTALFARTERR